MSRKSHPQALAAWVPEGSYHLKDFEKLTSKDGIGEYFVLNAIVIGEISNLLPYQH